MPLWGRMLRQRGQETAYDRAVHLFDEGRYAEAITELEAILSKTRPNALTAGLARFYLAEAHTALAKHKDPETHSAVQAVVHLQRALALHPTFPDLHFRLACAYVEVGELGKATEAVGHALSLNPRYADALHLSEALAKGEAHLLLEKTPESREDDVAVHSRLALELYRKGEFAGAVDAYRQALALAPAYADLHNQLGVALHAADRDAEAIQAFTRAIEINPAYLEARLNRGIALRCLGRESAAQDDFERVLELDPKNAGAREALSPP